MGIPLGLGTATLGGMFVWVGAQGISITDDNSPGAIAGGAIMLGAGLAAFIYSSIKLRRNLNVRFERCGVHNMAHRRDPPRRRIVFDGASFRF